MSDKVNEIKYSLQIKLDTQFIFTDILYKMNVGSSKYREFCKLFFTQKNNISP